MKPWKPFEILLAAAASCLAACGAPDALDLCYSNCGYIDRCITQNSVLLQNCRNECTDKRSSFTKEDTDLAKTCYNVAEIRNKQASCYGRVCGEIPGCLLAATPGLNCVFIK